MINKLRILLAILVFTTMDAQEIKEENTDVLLQTGLNLYRQGDFKNALKYAEKGIQLAPLYHDIRLLRIRSNHALGNIDLAEEDLYFLAKEAPLYGGVKNLIIRQSRLMDNKKEALEFAQAISGPFGEDLQLSILIAELKMDNRDYSGARALAEDLIKNKNINSDQRYALNQILKNTIKNSLSTAYEIVDFDQGYGDRRSWHTNSLEYQHSINKTILLGRITYTNRITSDGFLYEVESYPTLNKKTYLFLNLGLSDGTLFPDLRTSASLYYNIAKGLEIELGGRMLSIEQQQYFTGITGLSAYIGQFYLNLRAALGPERENKLVQNYQFNARYYVNGADNYILARISRGISPDESTLFTQVQENPELSVNYFGIGANIKLGIRNIINLNVGYLFEEITASRSGKQFLGSLRYTYRL